jgi:hypothetical protein
VIANGSVLARQAVNESGTTQLVTYEFRDASGLSATSGGSGDSPVPGFEHFYLREELDGLANNVGRQGETTPQEPYRNEMSPDERPQFDNSLMGDCSLDGIITPCSMALRLLGSGGADIDWQNTDRWAASRMGITAFWIPDSGRTPPTLPGSDDDDVIRVNTQQDGGTWEYRIAVGWGLQQQTQPPKKEEESKPCKPPTFNDLLEENHPVLGLFPGEFDADAEAFYNGIGERNQRVLLNTVDALTNAGVDLSSVRFQNFYVSNKRGHLSYGLVLVGLDKFRLGNLTRFFGGYRSPGQVGRGSLEIGFAADGVAHVDIDLHNPNAGLGPLLAHFFREVFGNWATQKPTDPKSATKALNKRGVNTTIRGCK